ncbi:MAG: hypothetical protein ACXWC9_03650, partial [Pseudobdellovibrionaceae bacterium]
MTKTVKTARTSKLISIGFCLGLSVACKSHVVSSDKVEAEPAKANWSQSMRLLQQSLTELGPILFDSQKYKDPKRQEFLKQEIQKMAAVSKNVVHDSTIDYRDPTVRFVADQFAQDLQRANRSFLDGRQDYARFQLIKVTSYCVECHTRTRQGPEIDSTWGSKMNFQEMEIVDQAEFLIASRKFLPAFRLLLKSLQSTNQTQLGRQEQMAKLALQIAVQYQQDPKMALKVITAVQKNPKTSYYLKTQALSWKESVQKWQQEPERPVTLLNLQALFQNRTSEIDTMRVIPGVLKILVSNPTGDSLGEALLLAGQAYENISGVSFIEIHENYYRACIRNRPHSAIAQNCLQHLRKSVTAGYSGSSGTHLPVEIEIE